MSTDALARLESELAALPLVDHHVHGATRGALSRSELEVMLTEAAGPIPGFMTQFDSQIGLAVRRWCAPVLGLDPNASAGAYIDARTELGAEAVNQRLLTASGVGALLLETGYRGDVILDPAGMQATAGVPCMEVVRIETVMEQFARTVQSGAEFVAGFPAALRAAAASAVGLKTIIAYRYGFDFDPDRPDSVAVEAAAERWLADVATGADPHVDDVVLLRYGVWTGCELGLPLQMHAGYGDADLELHRCDPLLLTRWLKNIEALGVDVILLHCYPYHRNAGYLAQVFPHVYFDVGLGVNYSGLQSHTIIAESLELAPFAKVMYSSDAWGPAELHFLGAHLWRRGMARVLAAWVEEGECSMEDAVRIARMIGVDNARRVYRLDAR